MPQTLCVHCSMREYLHEGQSAATLFEETPDQHLARVHSDVEATARERAELDATLKARMPWAPAS